MAGIEIKKLRNWDGPIEQFIKELEVFKRRYPGQKVTMVDGRGGVEVWIYKEEKEDDKPSTASGIFRSEQLRNRQSDKTLPNNSGGEGD